MTLFIFFPWSTQPKHHHCALITTIFPTINSASSPILAAAAPLHHPSLLPTLVVDAASPYIPSPASPHRRRHRYLCPSMSPPPSSPAPSFDADTRIQIHVHHRPCHHPTPPPMIDSPPLDPPSSSVADLTDRFSATTSRC